MKVLITGSSGFIGKNITTLLQKEHEVMGTPDGFDLQQKKSITDLLSEVRPHAVIHCAGIVENSEKAQANPLMARNLLEAIQSGGAQYKNIIFIGSAAEYGIIRAQDLPVNEDVPLNATSPYGVSKVRESELAFDFRNHHHLPITVARLFNPIGVGMSSRQLVPVMMKQIREWKEGKRKALEVTRLDSVRDYIDVRDVASAIRLLLTAQSQKSVYNIGSGKATSNGTLIELMVKAYGLKEKPKVVETQVEKEPLLASCADISRIQKELGWKPVHGLEGVIQEIINAEV